MKPLITFALLTILAHTAEAKSLYRLSSNRFVHFPVGLSRCRLQISKPQLLRNPKQLDLASVALNNCPGTTGYCLTAVRKAVQRAKGMPLEGGVLSARNYGPKLVNVYGAHRLGISDPKQAPVGAIIIYNPVNPKKNSHGHIEIVTPKGFVSDHISHKPYASGGYVKGIYML